MLRILGPFALLALVLCWVPASKAHATHFFVAPNGNDANPGTFAEPWLTIAKANDELRAGDTVYLRAGVYDESIVPSRSGVLGRRITYANYDGEEVVLRGSPGKKQIVELASRSHVTIIGLRLEHQAQDIWQDRYGLVEIYGVDSEANEILDCVLVRAGDPIEFTANGYKERGIVVNAARNTLIRGNYIQGVNIGVHIHRAARFTRVLNNTITGTGQSSIDIGSSGGVLQGTLIQGNLLERSYIEDGIQFEPDYSTLDLSSDTSNQGTVIRDNVIRNCAEDAIDLKGAAQVVIEGNTIYGHLGSNDGPLDGWNRNSLGTIMVGTNSRSRDVIIRRNVIYDSAPAIWAFEGWKIYNNTLVNNNRDYEGPDSAPTRTRQPDMFAIMQWDEPADGIAIQNNIIASHNQAEIVLRMTGSKYLDHNLYFNPRDGTRFVHFREPGDWDTLVLSQWQRLLRLHGDIHGNEQHSFVADPMFIDVPEKPVAGQADFNFGLQDGSPAIDAGGPLTWTAGAGSGLQVPVRDAGYFFDGYGVTSGDLVQIGGRDPVRITAIDYGKNVITVDRPLSWEYGEGVSLPYRGAAPDIGAYECEGDCRPATPPPMPDKRVTNGLHAQYEFFEGYGDRVRDVSGVGTPLDLVIQDPSATAWTGDALFIHSPAIISSEVRPSKIIEACQASNEITLEAWIRPSHGRQDGPARILTLSSDANDSNFTLGQGLWGESSAAVFDVRLRTSETSANGLPSLSSLSGSARPVLTHLVYTRDASGRAKIYVDNELHSSQVVGGEFSNWNRGASLSLGNEAGGGRPWLGRVYLVAIYCRALSSHEVGQNYLVGLWPVFPVPRRDLPCVFKGYDVPLHSRNTQ
jgi:hypothetical protein